jgi:hypothetical protein
LPGALSASSFIIDASVFDSENSVIRIEAKDQSSDPLNIANQTHVGCISFNARHYFSSSQPTFNPGLKTQWITLFDDEEDDEYDGDFGVDDEELPMIRV